MHRVRVLALLALFVEHVHLFSWDIVVGGDKQLEFYKNGTLTHSEVISSANYITSVTYDSVHYRVLFADRHGSTTLISSFDLSTRTLYLQHLVRRTWNNYVRVVYDPVTQALYWEEGYASIYSFSLDPAISNKADGNLLVTLEHRHCRDLAVDSCGGYIYWITDFEIERARLDGSEREVLITGTVDLRLSLAIDQQTQKMYWTEKPIAGEKWSIESANFNGKNRTTVYIVRNTDYVFSLAVSKDFIYWQQANKQEGIWQLPKYSSHTVATKLHSMSSSNCTDCHRIAVNYTIKEQIQGIKSCDALQGLIPNDSKSESTVSLCQNYCIQGECRVSAEGQPTCSCMTGHSRERCEVNACHDYCLHGGVCTLNEEGKPACQCTAGYDGERCDVSICKDYCFQGNCSVGAEGQPKCSCMTGYSGERCEVNACHDYCLHGGVCTLNEEGKPACQCTAGYDGDRCDVSICKDYCFQGNCSVSAQGQPKCSCMTGYFGERCEVKACHDYCLNDGICSLNEEDEPACQCTAGYDGGRCELSANKDNSFDAGNSGKGTVSACHQFCLNHCACSLNEAREPVCQCTEAYEGDRCEVSVNKNLCCPTVTKVTVTLSHGVQSTCASTFV